MSPTIGQASPSRHAAPWARMGTIRRVARGTRTASEEAAMVPFWTEADLDAVARRARLVAFDLDNTLARSKQPMLPEMADRFSRLTRRIDVAVVTGGRQELVVSQVLDVLTPEADLGRLHLMPTSGTRYYRWRDGAWRLVLSHDLSSRDKARAVASLERHARALGLMDGACWGERIEDRGSQITFSALGQQAPEEAKRAWDADGSLKRRLAEAVQADLPDLLVRAGGYTSVDVMARGVDKAYAVRELAARQGIGVGDIVFVGDRMGPDGNDWPAVAAGAFGLRVDGPRDTLGLCEGLLARL